MTSAKPVLLALAALALLLGAMLADAHVRRARRIADEPAILAIAPLLPAADLALAGAARHLRYPSLEEPGAAFADLPAAPDTDPAGGAIAPPTDVYAASADPRAIRK
jgi:hypothetical protein